MEFKRTKPQEELDQETTILAKTEDGWIGSVPRDPANRHYAEFLKMEAEGYEAWWHDEEIDFEQSWEKEKAGLIIEPLPEVEPIKPVKKARKKKDPV